MLLRWSGSVEVSLEIGIVLIIVVASSNQDWERRTVLVSTGTIEHSSIRSTSWQHKYYPLSAQSWTVLLSMTGVRKGQARPVSMPVGRHI